MVNFLKFQTVIIFSLAFILGACGGSESTETSPEATIPDEEPTGVAPDLSEAGVVSGKVNFKGNKPKKVRIRMGAEPDCEKKHGGAIYSQEVEVNNNNTLRYVFIWVKQGLEDYTFEKPTESAMLNQNGCIYLPHVFGVQARQDIKIINSDSVTHNIHPLPSSNREWNISQAPNQEYSRSFPRQEIMIPVKCNIHPWMKSYIGVVLHPYFAVTGEDGSFELKNLPPGDYTIQAWHEKYGTLEQQVTVPPKETKTIEFTYEG